jgi:hypothetical protein
MQHVSTVLYTLYKGTPAHGEWVVACLEGAWRGIFGEPLDRKFRPVRFEAGRLTVEVTDSSWEAAVRGMRREIVDRLDRATSGVVTSLDLNSGSAPDSRPDA